MICFNEGEVLWKCMHIGAFMLMVFAIIYVVQTTTPIEKHYTTAQFNAPQINTS